MQSKFIRVKIENHGKNEEQYTVDITSTFKWKPQPK